MSNVINILILFSLILVPCADCFGEELFLHEQKLNGSILYTLKQRGDPVIELWKETINVPSDGKPMDRWCRLVASDKNQNGAVALVENNVVEITLLQFDNKNQSSFALNTFDPGWLKAQRMGAKLSARAPNQIIISFPNQKPETWSIVGGKLMDQSGKIYKYEQTLQIGSQGSEIPPQTATSNTVPAVVSNTVPPASIGKFSPETTPMPSTPSEEPTSSTPWSIIVVLIVAAGGLLWLLLKRRS